MAFDLRENFNQNKGLWIFVAAAMILAVLLAVFISPYASSSPDGLERVAEDKGFLDVAEETQPAWTHSIMPDYQIKAVKSEKVSTGISGLIGVLITLAVAVLIGLVVYFIARKVGKKEDPGTGNPISET